MSTNKTMHSQLHVIDAGTLAYDAALELQLSLLERVIARGDGAAAADSADAYLVLVQHDPPVVTLGRNAKPEHVLLSPQDLARRGVQIRQTGRGGDVTWHGPGQLVAYMIMKLRPPSLGLHTYIGGLQKALLATLGRFGIIAATRQGATGAWVGDDKIAAIGVAVRRWVTWHGMALNVCPDLSQFGLIVPCGLHETGVTTMSQALRRPLNVAEVKPSLTQALAEQFGFHVSDAVSMPIADCGLLKPATLAKNLMGD